MKKKLSKKAQGFLNKLKAQDGLQIPYLDANMASIDDTVMGDINNILPDLDSAKKAGVIEGFKTGIVKDPGKKSTTEGALDALSSMPSYIGSVGKIASGALALFNSGKQKKEAKLMDSMFKQDNTDRMEKTRASGYYSTPYTVGRTSDLTMQDGGHLPPMLWAPKPKGIGFEDNLEQGGMIPYQPYYKKLGGKLYNPYHMQDGGWLDSAQQYLNEGMNTATNFFKDVKQEGNKIYDSTSTIEREPLNPYGWKKLGKQVFDSSGKIMNYFPDTKQTVLNKGDVLLRPFMQEGGEIDPMAQFMQMYQNQEQNKSMVNQAITSSNQQQSQALNDKWKESKKKGISNLISGTVSLAGNIVSGGIMQDGGELDTESLYSPDFVGVGEPIKTESESETAFNSTMMQWIMEDEPDQPQQEYSEETTTAPYSGESTPQFDNVIDAIAHNESRGRYDVVNEQTQTVGKYQFMEKYWADKIRDYMGLPASLSKREVMTRFRDTPEAQEGFMKRTVEKEYKPEAARLKPLAQKYGLTEDDLIRLFHYRGISDTRKRLQTGNFEVSQSEQQTYKNPTIEEYLGKSLK